MKGHRHNKVKIIACPCIAKSPDQQLRKQTIQVFPATKLQILYHAAQFSSIKPEGPCSGIWGSLKNAIAAEVDIVVIKSLKGNAARRTIRGLNLECASFCPAGLANTAILLAGKRSGADNAVFRIDEV